MSKLKFLNQHSNDAEAFRFHELSYSFLKTLSFELIDDPRQIQSPYGDTRVTYKSGNGLFLLVGFSPADGRSVSITIGRRWQTTGGLFMGLSNYYSKLAKRFNIKLPIIYDLSLDAEITEVMENILEVLESSLPEIFDQTTIEDLIGIESVECGAAFKAKRRFGDNFLEFVKISTFPETE